MPPQAATRATSKAGAGGASTGSEGGGSTGRCSTGSHSCDGVANQDTSASQTTSGASEARGSRGAAGSTRCDGKPRLGTGTKGCYCQAVQVSGTSPTAGAAEESTGGARTGSTRCDGEAVQVSGAIPTSGDAEEATGVANTDSTSCDGEAVPVSSASPAADQVTTAQEATGIAGTGSSSCDGEPAAREATKEAETATCTKASCAHEFTLPAGIVVKSTFLHLDSPASEETRRAASAPPSLAQADASNRTQLSAPATLQPVEVTEHFLLTPRAGQLELSDGSADWQMSSRKISGDGEPAVDDTPSKKPCRQWERHTSDESTAASYTEASGVVTPAHQALEKAASSQLLPRSNKSRAAKRHDKRMRMRHQVADNLAPLKQIAAHVMCSVCRRRQLEVAPAIDARTCYQCGTNACCGIRCTACEGFKCETCCLQEFKVNIAFYSRRAAEAAA